MTKIQEVKQKIQDLIDKAVAKNTQQKDLLSFLFQKLGEVKELETLERLSKSDDWFAKYLNGYLLYKSISRANYQPEHLEITKLENVDKCLEMIEKDIEVNEPKESKPKEKETELTDQQLLTILSERLVQGKICLKKDGRYLFEVGKVGQPIPFKVFLDDGRTEPDLAKEFLKKHGIKGETQKNSQRNKKNDGN